MSFDIPGRIRSIEATGDLSASQYKFVKMSGATVVAVTAATDDAIGVLQNTPNKAGTTFQGGSGSAAAVMLDGVSRVKAGKALTAGTAVYLDTSGRVTDVAVDGKCVGITLGAAGAADDLVSVELKPLGAVGAVPAGA